MPASDGTVRGAFELETEQPKRELASLRDLAGEAQVAVRSLGETLDSIGRDRAALDGYRDSLRSVRDTAGDVAVGVRASWDSMREGVEVAADRMKITIDELDVKLDELGDKSPSPSVELQGVEEAKRQIDELNLKLDEFGRKRETAVARIRSSGGVPGMPSMLAADGGAGGGQGGLVGLASRASVLAGAPWWAALLPFAPGLVGGAGGLLGSLGGAALGAGAVGAGGVGALGVGGLLPGMIAVRSQQQDVSKAVQQYSQVADLRTALGTMPYGSLSSAEIARQEAQVRANAAAGDPTAQRQLMDLQNAQRVQTQIQTAQRNVAMSQTNLSPQQVGAAQSIANFGQWWQQAGGRITAPLYGAVPGILGNVQTAAGAVAPAWAGSMGAVGQLGTGLSGFVTQAPQLQFMTYEAQAFQAAVGPLGQDLEHVASTLENLTRAGTPFFEEALRWSTGWTEHLALATGDQAQMHDRMQTLVHDFQDWTHLGDAMFMTLRDLFSQGAPSGGSMVEDLTRSFDRWDVWVKTHPSEIRGFFHDAKADVEALAGAIGEIAKALAPLMGLITPIATEFANLVGNFGSLGLLFPGALGLGANMLRERLGGGAGAGGPAAAALGAAPLVGGGRTRAAVSGLIPAGAAPLERGLGLTYGIAPADLAATDMALGAGVLGPRLGMGAAAGRTLGGDLARVPGMLGGAAMAVRPYLLTGAGVNAAMTLGQYGTGGAGVTGLIDNLLSGASFGLVAPQRPTASGSDLRAQAAQAALGSITGSGGVSQLDLGLRDIHNFGSVFNEERLHANVSAAGTTLTGGAAVAGPGRFPATPQTLAQAEQGYQALGAAAERYQAAAERAHGKQRDVLLGEADAMRQLRGQYDQYQQQQAAALAPRFQQAFGILQGKEGPVKAMQETTRGVLDEMRKMSPAGAKVLGDSMLQWADAMARRDPKLRGVVDALNTSIQNSFSATGQHVKIVNDTILTGSTQEWQQIGQALTDPVERATEKVTAGFTQMQQEALGSLEAMGYSASDAKTLVSSIARGGNPASLANAAVSARQSGNQTFSSAATGLLSVGQLGAGVAKHRQRGGRLPGEGLHDTVRMADGGYGAPGELVVNRHTEADVDQDLVSAGKRPLSWRVATETRPHWQAMAGGGILARRYRYQLGGALGSIVGGAMSAMGHAAGGGYVFPFPQGAAVHWSRVDQGQDIEGPPGGYVVAIGPGDVSIAPPDPGGFGDHYPLLHLSAGPLAGRTLYYGHVRATTTGGVQAGQAIGQTGYGRGDTSWQGNAAGIPGHLELGFWPPGSMSSGGAAASLLHSLASHTAIGALGVGGGGFGGISITAPRSGVGGLPGAAADRAMAIYAAGLQQKVNARLGAMGGTGATGPGAMAGVSGNIMAIAAAATAAAGMSFNPSIVSTLLQKESSGGQNLPPHSYGGNVDPAGPFQVIGSTFAQYDPGGNRMNPPDNALAAMRYIKARYGSLEAMAAQTGLMGGGYHGYERGGRLGPVEWGGWHAAGLETVVSKPTLFGAGERGPERVSITPSGGVSHTIHVDVGGVTVAGGGDPHEIGDAVAHHVVERIIEALDRTQAPTARTM